MAIKFLNSVNADSGVLYVDADNNRVGIGTISPSSVLDVRGEVSITGGHLYFDPNGYSLIYDHDGTRDLIQVRRSGVNKFYLRGVVDDLQWEDGNQDPILKLNQNRTLEIPGYGSGTNTGTATYALSVDANGNIIEGTVQSNPAGVDGTGTIDYLTKWLDGDTLTDSNVYEASGDLVTTLNLKSSSSYPQLKLTDTDNSSTSSIRSAGGSLQHVLHDNTKSHVFYGATTADELMRITGGGLVGIGQANPVENLEVYDASANTWVVVETGLNNAGTQYVNTTSAWTVGINGANSDKFYIGNQEGLSAGKLILDTSGNLQLTAYTEGYLKSDASGNITVDTSIIEDTLDSVTDRNATTTNAITVGGLTVDTDTLHVDATNNRVGIHTTVPVTPLHIAGEDAIIRLGDPGTGAGGPHGIQFGYTGVDGMSMYYRTTPEYLIWEDSMGQSGTGLMVLERAGNLGIGNTAPSEKLHVTGNVRVTGAYYDSNNSPGLSGQILSSTGTGTDWVSLSEIQGVDGTGTANYLAKWSDIDTITDSVVYDNGTNVGIGTTSPSEKLHVTGRGFFDGGRDVLIDSSLGNVRISAPSSGGWAIGTFFNDAGGSDIGGFGAYGPTSGFDYYFIGDAYNDATMVIEPNAANVGIGTTSPSSKLHVAGDVRIDNTDKYFVGSDFSYITSTTAQDISIVANRHTTFSSVISGVAYERVRIKEDGKVGIATTNPQAILQVGDVTSSVYNLVTGIADFVDTNKDISDTQMGTLNVTSTSRRSSSPFNQGYGPSITFTQNGSGYVNGYERVIGGIKTEITNAVNLNYASEMSFYTHNNNSLNERMVLNSAGSLRLNAYTTGVLVTDANGNVSASTDYHTQDTADARYVNVTGDTMTGGLNIEVSTSNTQLKLKRTTTATGEFNIYTNTDSLYFHNVGQSTYPMMINSSGNVGIGTTNPVRELHLHSASNTQMQFTDNGTGSNDTDGLRIGWNGSVGQMYLFEDADIRFATNDSEKVRITSAGNLGIGTSNPSGKLHSYISATRQMGHNAVGGDLGVISDNNSAPVLYVKGTGTADLVNVFDNTTNVFTIKDGGNVGIGTTSPDDKLSVTGNAGLYGSVSGGIVSPASLKFYTSENNAGLGDSVDSNKQNIGQITWTGKDGSLNTVGEYAAIRSYVIDSNNLIQGSAGEGGQIELSTFRHDVSTETRVEKVALTISPLGLLSFPQYGAGYVKSDASGNLTVDNSTFLQEEVDTLASVTSRGNTTSQTTFFNGTVNIGASVGMTFSSSSEGATYTPTESTVGTSRYFLRFDTTNDASFPYLTNRTPSGAVVIKTGTAAGGAENEHFRIEGGDGVVDAYFTDVNLGVGTDSPSRKLHVNSGTTNHVATFESTDSTAYIQLKDSGAFSNIVSSDGNLELQADNGNNLSNSSIQFKIDSSEKMRLLSSGNLGIDRTNPLYKLHVYHPTTNVTAQFESGDNQAWISVRDSGYTTYGAMLGCDSTDGYSVILADNAATKRLTIDESGNVRFHAYGAGYLKTNANGTITLDTVTSVVDGTGTASYIPKWSDSDTLTDSVIYESSGSIGIGTESPTGTLEISQNLSAAETIDYPLVLSLRDDANSINQLGGEGVGIKFRIAGNADSTPGNSLWGASIAAIRESATDADVDTSLAFFTSAGAITEQVRIDSSGNVGIGTDSPSHKLTVNTGTNDIYFDEDTNINQGTGSSDQPAIYADEVLRIRQRVEIWDDNAGNNYLDIRNGSTQAIKLTPDGDSWITNNLGIGTTSPTPKLHLVYSGGTYSTDATSGFINQADTGRATMRLRSINDEAAELFFDINGGIQWDISARPSSQGNELRFYRAAATPSYGNVNGHTLALKQDGTIQFPLYGAGFIKSDASGNLSVDTTAYTAAQTLDEVTDLGNTTTNSISVGEVTLSNAPASNNGTFVKVYSDNHKRMYTATLNFDFTAAGTYNFNLVFPNSGGYQYELTAVNSRNGLYRNFGTLKDSSYIYWESDEDFTHRAEGDLHMISSYTGGMYFSADTTYFLSDGVTDSVQTGTANWSYAIVRYSIYIPRYDGDVTGSWKLHLTTYGDTGSGSPQFVLA